MNDKLYSMTKEEKEKHIQEIQEYYEQQKKHATDFLKRVPLSERYKPKEILFEGKFSGDCECFAWEVDFDTYKELYPKTWRVELEMRQEDCKEQGISELEAYNFPWLVYPSVIKERLDLSNKAYRISIKVEEI